MPGQCGKLEAPENGIVLQPCTGEYESSCIIQCKQGNGPIPYKQTCSLDNNMLKWTELPRCIDGSNFFIFVTEVRASLLDQLNIIAICGTTKEK